MIYLRFIATAAALAAADIAGRLAERFVPSVPRDLFDPADLHDVWDDDPVHDDPIAAEVARETEDLYLATQVARWKAEL